MKLRIIAYLITLVALAFMGIFCLLLAKGETITLYELNPIIALIESGLILFAMIVMSKELAKVVDLYIHQKARR